MPADSYIKELVEEIEILDPSKSMYTIQLLEEEIQRVRSKAKRKEEKEKLKQQEIVTLTEKIIVPVDKYPGHNFVGKLMGPKATTLKRIQAQTKSTILILGKGSTRDPAKEKLLRESDDPKYSHYKEPLHVTIIVKAFRSEAEERMAAALAEVNKYMDPNNEEVKQESIRTLAMLVTPNAFNLAGVAPIIKVGVPPPGSIILSGQPVGSNLRKPDPYKYEATFDGTYEGYPSTKPDASASETPSSSSNKRPISLSPDSSSYSDSETSEKRSKNDETYDPFGILQ